MDLVESKARIVPPEARHPWELARLAAIKRVIRESVSLQPGANILDVGCGDAFLVSQLAKEFPAMNFIAVDTALTPDLQAALQRAWSVKNLAMFPDLAGAERELQNRPVSLVLLLDVIEHIEDDVGFLKHLQTFQFFTAETAVIITVPAFQQLYCAHDKFLGHYRRYTNRMLERHVAQAGLRPVQTNYVFASLLPLRCLQVIWEKLASTKPKPTTGLVEWRDSRMLARLLQSILFMDFLIGWKLRRFGIKLWGLSNLAICRR